MSFLVVVRCLWLALAVVVAGILHMVIAKKNLFPGLKVPLDGGRLFRGKPLFGPNKTWRGVVFMTLATALLGAVQGYFLGAWADRADVAPMDYLGVGLRLGSSGVVGQALGYGLVNLAIGLGYALGELPNSFLKRRLEIDPGKTTSFVFFVIDQADSVVAALVLAALLFPLPWAIVLVGSIVLTLVHFMINGSLYLAKIRRNL